MNTSIKDLQKKIVELMVYFDAFCKENGIVYYLMGGSALGAMRHQGFIPWDDDLDVFMTYENYQKFTIACREKLDTQKYYFQEENTEELPIMFSKIRMNGTTFIEEGTINRKMHKGVFIDIMCLNDTSTNDIVRGLQYLAARLVTTKGLIRYGYKTNSQFKKFILLIVKFLVSDKIFDKLLSFVRSFNGKGYDMVGHFMGRARFKNTSFPKAYLGEPRYVKFEDIMLPVPENVEEYLRVRFGDDYMKMPDETTKSKYPIHAIYVDLEKDYRVYEEEQNSKV